jgi:hypothetical protein
VVELVFGGLGLVPGRDTAKIPDSGVSWDYTTWLNIAFLLLAAALVIRFARTGGGMMLRMMGGAPEQPGAENGHGHHDMHGMTAGHDTDGAHRAPPAPQQAGSRRPGREGDQGHPRRGHDS